MNIAVISTGNIGCGLALTPGGTDCQSVVDATSPLFKVFRGRTIGHDTQIAANVWASGGQLSKRLDMAGLAAPTRETDDETQTTLTAPKGVSVTITQKGT